MVQIKFVFSAAIFSAVFSKASASPIRSSLIFHEDTAPSNFNMEVAHDDMNFLESEKNTGLLDRDSIPRKPDGTFDFDDLVAFARQAASGEATEDMKAWSDAISYWDCETSKEGGMPCLTMSASDQFLSIATDGSREQDPFAVEILLNFLRWRKSLAKAPTGPQIYEELYEAIDNWPRSVL